MRIIKKEQVSKAKNKFQKDGGIRTFNVELPSDFLDRVTITNQKSKVLVREIEERKRA
ncbi:hypothetical protein [Phosphitispora sp. TUW77]|uniref:hypothetical protein n=1 Tax=Phosphitispora sp. TUW77 TaxID=3152361 RepID=UPI003AB27437